MLDNIKYELNSENNIDTNENNNNMNINTNNYTNLYNMNNLINNVIEYKFIKNKIISDCHEIIYNLQKHNNKTIKQGTDDWLRLRENKIGSSQISNLISNKYSSYKDQIISSINNEKINNIYTQYGSLFELVTHNKMKELINNSETIINSKYSDKLLNNLGIFIHQNSVYSPDSILIQPNMKYNYLDKTIINKDINYGHIIIHLLEYKTPPKRSIKNLHKEYYNQLNYGGYILHNLLTSLGYKYQYKPQYNNLFFHNPCDNQITFSIKLHFLACRITLLNECNIK